VGLDALVNQLPVPVIGVIEPGARIAAALTQNGRIGVIGTTGTIRSGAYERAIRELSADARLTVQPCPLFVPLVEEGWIDKEATRLVAREYLEPLTDAGVDAVVLGCTHYPLLKGVIGDVLGEDVRLIDSAAETAAEVRRALADEGLEAPASGEPLRRFVASDDSGQFLRLGQRFLGEALDAVELHTFR
jgi:glutamate racemase